MSFVQFDLVLTFVTVLLMQEEDIKGIWSIKNQVRRTSSIQYQDVFAPRLDFAHAEVETVVERFFEKI